MPVTLSFGVACLTLATLWTASAGRILRDTSCPNTPVVDLGYNLHRAVSSDSDEAVYTFSNIQYATADRFAKAVYPPPTDRSQIFNGSQQSICPQAYPAWQFSAINFLDGANLSNSTTEELLSPSLLPPVSYSDENCLHIDVQVAKSAFNSLKSNKNAQLLPILVYIHGGGYVQGHKAADGNGTGLIARAMELGSDGIVFMAFNYRLGAFGWLSSGDDLIPNLGLHDQLVALRWIQDYAHLFGGDASRITVISQSAGAGSAAIHVANSLAQGTSVPFHQAILQSPYVSLLPTPQTQASTYQQILTAANASSFEDLKTLDTSTLQDANYATIATSAYGGFTFGPVVDAETFTAPLPELLSRVKDTFPLMVGTNSQEGLLFTAPNVQNDEMYLAALQSLVPYLPSDILANLTSTLYPSSSFTSEVQRLNETLADLAIRCTAHSILSQFADSAYDYQYSVPSGVHAADLHYTFFDGNVEDLPQGNVTVAHVFQSYIASFVLGGSPTPDLSGVPDLTLFGEKLGVDVNITGITQRSATWLSETICAGMDEILSGAWS
ncbi:Alpha/Beta hydrolase protein [Nemania sp. FL0916]|nr:Alpha/Beta hydrolase protein [Nemania sp. FL0916]